MQTVWQGGTALPGRTKGHALADGTQREFKQLQAGGGRGGAWPGKPGPRQPRLTIYSAVAYLGLPGGPENCPENRAWKPVIGSRRLHSGLRPESRWARTKALCEELKDGVKNRIFLDREFLKIKENHQEVSRNRCLGKTARG